MHAPAASLPWEEPKFSLNRRMDGRQIRSRNFGAHKYLLFLSGFEPWAFTARNVLAIQIK